MVVVPVPVPTSTSLVAGEKSVLSTHVSRSLAVGEMSEVNPKPRVTVQVKVSTSSSVGVPSSVTVIVTAYVPSEPGGSVPLMRPVLELTVMPAGRPVAE